MDVLPIFGVCKIFLAYRRRRDMRESGESIPTFELKRLAGFGGDGEAVAELVFDTAMIGYQEIISDPSYTYQAVVMTYPLIGNYGVTEEDNETNNPQIGALIVREYNDSPSNFRYTKTLGETLEEDNAA